MSVSMTVAETIKVGGVSFPESRTLTGDAAIVHDLNANAANAAALSTRTSDTAGTLTMTSSSHTIETGDRIDIYWSGGQARGATVGTVNGNSVPFTLATGDVMPTEDTVVTACVALKLDLGVLGTNVVAIALYGAGRSTFVFAGADNVEDLGQVVGAGTVWTWTEDDGTTNPITADTITKVFASQANAAAAAVRVGVLYDND
uniref:Uncharacterized protein n=1 Tax=viral metagenome TaxID=1070528 RepID=A0A6M3K2V3_9ZZZZ